MTKDIETYLADGCGRCSFFATPECKVNRWRAEIMELRRIVLATGLQEEMKWGGPCYTYNGANLIMVGALKANAMLSFFKGVLLADPEKILESPGEYSQSYRSISFTSPQQVTAMEETISAYIYEAIEAEKAGLKVDFKQKDELVYPEELLAKFAEDPQFEAAFEALTPGRKRGYVLHISQAKQSATRTSRIEKWVDQIMDGKGMHD